MYLTCPNCEAVFEISERHFVNGPRQVRCTACRHQWSAEANASATINDLMGEEAEGAFEGLNNFLEQGDKQEEASIPATPPTTPTPQPTAKREFRGDAISMALSQHTEPKKGGFFSSLFIFVGIPVGIFFALKHAKPEIISRYPDAIYIYDFLETLWVVAYTAGEDIWEHILRLSQQLF